VKIEASALKLISTLKVEISTLKVKISTLKVEISTLKVDISTLKVAISSLEVEISSFDRPRGLATLSALYNELPNLSSNVNRYRGKCLLLCSAQQKPPN